MNTNQINKYTIQMKKHNSQINQLYQYGSPQKDIVAKSHFVQSGKIPSAIISDKNGEDLFMEKIQRKKLKQENQRLNGYLSQQRERNKKLESMVEDYRKRQQQLQSENQSLKQAIFKMQKEKASSLIRIDEQPTKTSNNKSKLSIIKSLSPPKEQSNGFQPYLEKAIRCLSREGASPAQKQRIYKQAENDLMKALNEIQKISQKNGQIFQTLAFIYSNLITIKCGQQKDLEQIEQIAKKALSIYNSKQGVYFQQKIVILNNLGLYYEKKAKLDQALQAYKQVEKIQSQYYSINDERKVLILNNIACAYCQKKMIKQGLEYFNRCKEIVKKRSSLQKLVYENMAFYKAKISQGKNLPYKGEKFQRWLLKQPKYKLSQ